MINRASIIQWSKQVPWNDNAQIEQDLIISRALVAIFSDEFLSSQLAFSWRNGITQTLSFSTATL